MSIEWALVFFTLFAGFAAGTFIGVAVTEWTRSAAQVRLPGATLALIALIISGISSVLHLGHPERIFGALGHPASGIFMEALFMGLFGLLVIFYLLALKRKASAGARKFLATVGVIPAIALAFGVGYTYVMPSRPAWDTITLPLLYLVSAGVMGCFSIAMLLPRTTEVEGLSKASMAFLGIQAVLTTAFIGHLAFTPYADATRSASRVLLGDMAPLFWIGIVLLGLAAPYWIMRRSKKTGIFANVQLGLLCTLVSGIAFRALMFTLGSGVRNFF